MPLDGVEQEPIAHVSSQPTVTVTSSPPRGIDAWLFVHEPCAARSCRVVPHLSARLVANAVHLRALLARLDEISLCEVFVIAGARGPVGRPRVALGHAATRERQ